MLRTLTSAVALTLFCTPAFSQELDYGAVGLGYSALGGDGVDFSSTMFEGQIEYSFNQFLLGGELRSQTIDSFGGEVAGAFDLADRIRAVRAQKPVHAFVAEHALSAGYVLASQADQIILPRTGAVGSISPFILRSPP